LNIVIYLSIATASISFTVTETKLFQPFRKWLKNKSEFLGDLFSCGYCFGHWIAFTFTALYRPKLISARGLLDLFLTAIIIAWFAGLQWAMMCWLMERTGK
jgi:hypothetical protein